MQTSVALQNIMENAAYNPVNKKDWKGGGRKTLSTIKTWQLHARAVAFNLNAHFLFYFQILSGILGMLRRAGYKALSTK